MRVVMLSVLLCLAANYGCSSREYHVYESLHGYQYASDQEGYGVAEFWPTTQQFHRLRRGDCDAFAGYFSEQLNVPVTIGYLRQDDGSYEGHAWVVSTDYILDNLGVHWRGDNKYRALYTIPNWHQAALIQQRSLKYGDKAREYFGKTLAPIITMVD